MWGPWRRISEEERRHFRGRGAAVEASLAAVTELMLLLLLPLLVVADAAFGDPLCSCSEAEEAVTAGMTTAAAAWGGGGHNLLIHVRTSALADKHPGYVPPPAY